MHYSYRLFTCLLAYFAAYPIVSAQDSDINQIALVIKQKQSTPESKHQAIEVGRERALLCSVCHGRDGNSAKADVPNLAGQNPVYLLNQIEKFADGRRKNYVMNSLAKDLSSDDKINLAIFYNSMPVKQVSVDKQLAIQGKKLYETQCSSCHGERGSGSISFARIAGQQSLYVFKTLKQFRDNANSNVDTKPTKRNSRIMEPIVKQYTDKELEIISAYIAQLQ